MEVCPVAQVKKEVEDQQQGGAEPLEDWQREVDDDIQEEEGSTPQQPRDWTERQWRKRRMRAVRREKKKKRRMVTMALPFLIGISPAGFLSANKKQPGGTDHLVQVRTPDVVVILVLVLVLVLVLMQSLGLVSGEWEALPSG